MSFAGEPRFNLGGFVGGRHRAAESLNFPKEIDAQVPEGLDSHIVMDNYGRTDIGFESSDGGMNTSPEPLSGELSEPAARLD
jgi:hypothetical protein